MDITETIEACVIDVADRPVYGHAVPLQPQCNLSDEESDDGSYECTDEDGQLYYANERAALEKMNLPHKLVQFCKAKDGQWLALPANAIAIPWIEGSTLWHMLQDPPTAIPLHSLKEGVAAWATYMSSYGIVHRDLHSGNCMIRVQGPVDEPTHVVRLIDFGLTEIPVKTMSDDKVVAKEGITLEERIAEKAWNRNGADFRRLIYDCKAEYGLEAD